MLVDVEVPVGDADLGNAFTQSVRMRKAHGTPSCASAGCNHGVVLQKASVACKKSKDCKRPCQNESNLCQSSQIDASARYDEQENPDRVLEAIAHPKESRQHSDHKDGYPLSTRCSNDEHAQEEHNHGAVQEHITSPAQQRHDCNEGRRDEYFSNAKANKSKIEEKVLYGGLH